MGRELLEFGHSQVSDGDEVARGSESASGALGLLQRAVHGLDKGVRAVVGHAAHDGVGAFGDRLGELLERVEPTASRPAQPRVQFSPSDLPIVARCGSRIDRAQRRLQPPCARALQRSNAAASASRWSGAGSTRRGSCACPTSDP